MSLHSRQPIGYRQTMTLNIQCGFIEYETVKQAAKAKGYPTIVDFLRDAINAYLDQPVLIPRTSKNQYTGNRGKTA